MYADFGFTIETDNRRIFFLIEKLLKKSKPKLTVPSLNFVFLIVGHITFLKNYFRRFDIAIKLSFIWCNIMLLTWPQIGHFVVYLKWGKMSKFDPGKCSSKHFEFSSTKIGFVCAIVFTVTINPWIFFTTLGCSRCNYNNIFIVM